MMTKKIEWDDEKLNQTEKPGNSTKNKSKKQKQSKLEQDLIKDVDRNKSTKISKLPISNKIVLRALHENEEGDAYLLIKCLKDKYVYDHASKDWYYWNENFWRLDKIDHIFTMTKKVVELYGNQQIYENLALQNAKKTKDEDAESEHKYNLEMLRDRIKSMRTVQRKDKILKIARSGLKSLGITGEEWDKNPMLLGCRNGCIDLENGTFIDGKPSDYIRLVSPIKWEGVDAERIVFEKFMLEMFSNDQGMVDYIQRLLGYGITGLNTEHVFPIFWGPKGRNGKSTLFEIIKYILGELAYKAPSNFIMDNKVKSSGKGPDAVTMGLVGKRLVWFSEANEHDRFDIGKMKEMSGGDTLVARAPHAKRQVEFSSSHLILIILNKKPKMPANDKAIWERTHLIPLENSFIDKPNLKNKNEFKSDKKLKTKLRKEASGILAWLVEGCILWQEHGLDPPDKVLMATEDYRGSQDIFGHYLKECCVEGDHVLRVSLKKIYENYKKWCSDVGHHPMARNRVFEEMKERFGKRVLTRGSKFFRGITLSDDPEC